MNLITTISILLATLLWTLAICRGWAGKQNGVTTLWTIGFAFFAIHIIAAFQKFYHWSNGVALAETARQTRELTGWDSGLGLYVNYTFAICLLGDLFAQYRKGPQHRGRKSIDGFVIFMILNGAIIFGTVSSRIVGTICLVFFLAARRRGKSP